MSNVNTLVADVTLTVTGSARDVRNNPAVVEFLLIT